MELCFLYVRETMLSSPKIIMWKEHVCLMWKEHVCLSMETTVYYMYEDNECVIHVSRTNELELLKGIMH